MPSPSESTDITLAALMDSASSIATPLDAAADYWRAHVDSVLPWYLLAMTPHAVIVTLLISAIVAEERSASERYSMLLVAATLWRWIWIARLQLGVQRLLRLEKQPVFWRRVPQIVLLKLFGSAAVSWGMLLAGAPAFYGFFIGSFAAPLLLESDEPSLPRVRQSLGWVHHSGKRLFRITLALIAITLLILVALLVSQYILSYTLLPTLLGIDTAELNLTLNSWAWRLSVFYFVFLIVDGYWSVAAVLVYYDSQSRRTATDLQARLMQLIEETG